MKPFGVIHYSGRLLVYWPDGTAQFQGEGEKVVMTPELQAAIDEDRERQSGKPAGNFGAGAEQA